MRSKDSLVRFAAATGLIFLVGCAGSVRDAVPGEAPAMTIGEAKEEARTLARDALQDLYAEEPAAKKTIENAAGYAVFSNFGTKIPIAGRTNGTGIAFRNPTRQETFMGMQELQADARFGVGRFRQVWVFQYQAAFDAFVDKGYESGGQPIMAVASGDMGSGVVGAASVSPGVWLYQLTDKGLAPEVSIKGAKYYRDGKLN